jgi:hypothetical protein
MTFSTTHIPEKITLSTKRIPRIYSALISTMEQREGKKTETTIFLEFMLACFGHHPKGGLGYRLETRKRLLLDSKKRPIKSLTKAQKLALKVAEINNKLVLRVNRNFGLLEVVNTRQIRERWAKIKAWLLQTHPDAKDLTDDYDRQLREDRIQRLFKDDVFYNYFFADFFSRPLPHIDQKIVPDSFGNIDLPVNRKLSIQDHDPATIHLKCDLDTESPDFPIDKMNTFLGELLKESGSKRPLNFNCKGSYDIQPDTGLITGGTFSCSTEINELYSKKTDITLNIENNG